MNYVVFTPAGKIYLQTALQANEYKQMYGYFYRKLTEQEKKELS